VRILVFLGLLVILPVLAFGTNPGHTGLYALRNPDASLPPVHVHPGIHPAEILLAGYVVRGAHPGIFFVRKIDLPVQTCRIAAGTAERFDRGGSFGEWSILTFRRLESPDPSRVRYLFDKHSPAGLRLPPGTLSRFPSIELLSIPGRLIVPILRTLPIGEDYVILWDNGVRLGDPLQAHGPEETFAMSPAAASLNVQKRVTSPVREKYLSNSLSLVHTAWMGPSQPVGGDGASRGSVNLSGRAPPW
jgi:hypothetical protein